MYSFCDLSYSAASLHANLDLRELNIFSVESYNFVSSKRIHFE